MNLKKLFAYAATAALATNVLLPGAVLAQDSTFTSQEIAAFQNLFDAKVVAQSNPTIEIAGGNNTLTREQLAVYLVRADDLQNPSPKIIDGCDSFNDSADAMNPIVGDFVVKSCERAMLGAQGTQARSEFFYKNTVTNAQAATAVAKLLTSKKFGDPEYLVKEGYGLNGATAPHYSTVFMNWLKDQGIWNSYFDNAGVDTTMPRKAAFVLIDNTVKFIEDGGLDDDDDICIDAINQLINGEDCPDDDSNNDDDDSNDDDTDSKSGDLDVELGSNSPVANSSIPNVGTVKFAEIDFTAGNDTVFVYSVDVKRKGLGNYQDLDRVYFEKDGIRGSAKTSFTSDEQSTITFAPALEIAANSTESLDLVVELSGATGAEHYLEFIGVNSSAASINAQVMTPQLRTADYTVGSIDFESRGNNTTHKAGDSDMLELAQFRLVNTSAQDRDIRVKAISLRNDGTADLDDQTIKTIALYRDSVKVSTNYYIDGKDIIFQLDATIDETLLEDGTSANFWMRGDVGYVDNTNGDTYDFTLRDKEDLNAIEDNTGFRVTVDRENVSLATYTVEASDVTFRRTTDYDLNTTVVPGTDEVVLMRGTISANETIQLEDPSLSVVSTLQNLSDIANKFTLRIGNTSANWTPSASNGSSATAQFFGTFIVNGGDEVDVELVVDIRSQAMESTLDVTQDLDINRFAVAEYLTNNNNINSSVGTIAGAFLNISQTDLNMTRTDGLSARTLVAGANEATLMAVTFSTTDNIRTNITQIDFTGVAPASFNNNITATLYVDGVAKRTDTYSSNALSFSSLNIDVEKNAPVVVEVKADFTQSLNAGSLDLTLSSVSATDANSQTVNPTPATLTAPTVTMAGAGSISLTENTQTPSSSLIAGGMTSVELARFNITAQNDNPRLTDLYLDNQSDADISNRIANVKLYDKDDMSTAIATAVLRDGGIAFDNISTANFSVPSGTTKTLVVKADINNVLNIGDVTAGSGVQLALSGGFNNPTVGQVNGIRMTSQNGSTLTAVNGGNLVIGKVHRIVRGKPTVALVSEANWSIQKSSVQVMEYTVTADQERITVTDFDYTFAGLLGGETLNVYKNSVSPANLVGTTAAANGNATLTLSQALEIQAGDSQRFIVQLAGYTPTANDPIREFSIQGLNYLDMFQDGNLTVNDAEAYTNVGSFPLTSTFSPN